MNFFQILENFVQICELFLKNCDVFNFVKFFEIHELFSNLWVFKFVIFFEYAEGLEGFELLGCRNEEQAQGQWLVPTRYVDLAVSS